MQFRKKDGTSGTKNALKVAQSGTPVPAKDSSTPAKIAKADDKGGKGSMTVAKSLPSETASSTPVAQPKKTWESSSEDWSKDYNAAKRRGISVEDHEDSARDRISDAAGERKFNADESDKPQTSPGYKRGVSAFSNSPKAAHGFGHPSSARDGHLRNSGRSDAHRIGKK